MDRPSVLVVERSTQLRQVLCRLLEGRGYQVTSVGSRSEGFDLLDELCPDLLILDDPAQERTYRFIWLRETDQPDVRVELVDLQPDVLSQQLVGLIDERSVA